MREEKSDPLSLATALCAERSVPGLELDIRLSTHRGMGAAVEQAKGKGGGGGGGGGGVQRPHLACMQARAGRNGRGSEQRLASVALLTGGSRAEAPREQLSLSPLPGTP